MDPLPVASLRSGHMRAFVALTVAIVLLSACSTPQTSVAPSDGRSPAASVAASTPPGSTSPSGPPTASVSPAAARWEPAGTMPVALREKHAVLLGDGRVLVVGNPLEGTTTGAFLWDPTTHAWKATESLNKRRSQFAMARLDDGRALVTGGLNDAGESYSSTYIYDPAQETWSRSGLLGTARTSPAAALLPDGRVLVAGGYFAVKPTSGLDSTPDIALAAFHQAGLPSGPSIEDIEPQHVGAGLATAEIFDPATGNWSPTGSLQYARSGASALTLADGRVLVVGFDSESSTGVTVDGRAFRATEIYDPTTGKFSLAGQLPDIDRAALQKQGAKGANPVPDEEPDPAGAGTLVALKDGGAVLIGQSGWWKHVGDITRSFRFDAATGAWGEIGKTWIVIGEPTPVSLETPGVRNLAGSMAAMLADGRVLVAGGEGSTPNGSNTAAAGANRAEAFDPSTSTWSPLPSMPEARSNGAVVVLSDGSALLVDGDNSDDNIDGPLSTAVRFVP